MRFFFLIFAALLALAVPAQLLPVDTAVVVTVGPLVDDTDFKTLETAIAHNAAGMSVDLIQSSGAATTKTDLTLTTGSTQDWTHVGNGVYEIEITSAQNTTEGSLQVVGVADGVLPFFSPVYTVVPVLVYNSLVGGTDTLPVDAVQIEGVDPTDAIRGEADAALAAYDPPTNAEMEARTIPAANYFDPATDEVTTDSASREASKATGFSTHAAADIWAVPTRALSSPNDYKADVSGLATAAALDTVDGIVDSILADTGELQTRFANMIEADGGDWRFTANALEQAPGSGGGGDATAANQTTILDRLAGIMDKDHTLASAVGDFDPATDSLEAIRIQGDAAWGGGGGGDTVVNHDTGGAGNLKYVTGAGAGIQGASVRAYVKSEYDAGVYTVRGETVTKADGTWASNMMLNSGVTYTIVFFKAGAYGPDLATVTP